MSWFSDAFAWLKSLTIKIAMIAIAGCFIVWFIRDIPGGIETMINLVSTIIGWFNEGADIIDGVERDL